jgi:hypothetical protein
MSSVRIGMEAAGTSRAGRMMGMEAAGASMSMPGHMMGMEAGGTSKPVVGSRVGPGPKTIVSFPPGTDDDDIELKKYLREQMENDFEERRHKSRSLIINYLPQGFTEEQLRKMFEVYGAIHSVRIMKDVKVSRETL